MTDTEAASEQRERRLFQLPRHFSLLLHECSRRRRTILDNALKPLGLTRTQTMLLATLSNLRLETSQRELAAALKTSKVNVGMMLNLLEESGYIMRTTHARDKRIKTLTISEAGYLALEQASEAAHRLEPRILAGIDPDDLHRAEEVLRQVQRNLIQIDQDILAAQPSSSAPVPHDELADQ